MSEYTDIKIGPLPVNAINEALGLELEPGDVVFKSHAQRHAKKRHADFDQYRSLIPGVVIQPLYVGDDFKNPGKIELIARFPAKGIALLVALSIEVDASGDYHIHSAYRIDEKKVQGRLRKGYLKRVK